MLNAVADNLWVASQPLRFFGAQIGCRMTCIRLSTGAVAVHSPIRADEQLLAAVEGLGSIGWLIGPNGFHHLFLRHWCERFPEATVLVAPRILAKRRDLSGAVALHEAPDAWADELEMLPIEGLPQINEFVFFHRSSATLVITDLAFNFSRDSPFTARWMIRLSGRLGELAPTLVERLFMRDRAAFRRSLERVLEWPFDRVVMSHGEIVDSDGRAALRRGYDWLLDS